MYRCLLTRDIRSFSFGFTHIRFIGLCVSSLLVSTQDNKKEDEASSSNITMTKHVVFNESSNQVKEYIHLDPDDKTNYWVSKEDIMRFRREVHAEALLSQTRAMVTKVIMGLNQKTEEDEMTTQQVDSIMAGGMQGTLQFLDQNGVKLAPPPPLPPPPPPPPSQAAMSDQEMAGQQQVRNMIRQKLLADRPTGVSEDALERQIQQIMQLPRPKILEFLQQQQPPPPRRINWIVDSTDYWKDLPPTIRQAAQVLGYNEELWNNSEQPNESDMAFRNLSEMQQRAVLYLGSTPDQWDNNDEASSPPPPPPPPEDEDDEDEEVFSESDEEVQKEPTQDEIMMIKIRELVATKLRSDHNFPSEAAFQRAIGQIMSLPRDKIKEFLQKPSPRAEPLAAEEPNPEVAMMEKIRGLVAYKLQRELNIFEPSDLLEGAIDEIMSLPREQIKMYLERPLLPKDMQPKQFNWVWDSDAEWVDLPTEIQEAATELGFAEDTWNKTEQPAESDMEWDALTPSQQRAAAVLGYTKEQWDDVGQENEETSSGGEEEEEERPDSNFAIDNEEEKFFSNFLSESKPKGGLNSLALTDDETEFSDSETEQRTSESSLSQSSSKQDPFTNKLETFMTLWAFDPNALNT
eukprot:scaffold629_cov140-Cylindrotheca_fusiformis.AAC.3